MGREPWLLKPSAGSGGWIFPVSPAYSERAQNWERLGQILPSTKEAATVTLRTEPQPQRGPRGSALSGRRSGF